MPASTNPHHLAIASTHHTTVHRLSHNLRSARARLGLSQTEVAQAANITRGAYSRLESAKGTSNHLANPRLSTLIGLSAALGVTVPDLLAADPRTAPPYA